MEERAYTLILEAVRQMAAQTALLYCRQEIDRETELNDTTSYTGMKPEQILKNVFGYESFRPLQREIIQNVLDGRDTLAVMPTGGGKSLCYEIPALILNGLTVVVSPLIALMQDQVTQLASFGIEAVFLNSSLDWDSYRDTADRIRDGEIKLLYVSPEGLNTQKIQDILHSEKVTVKCITIDEAHCVSEWGHDFRPDYLEIASIREQFPKAVCLALTATATKQVRNDIITQLKLETPAVLVASFNRPNIFLEVRRKSSGLDQVISFLHEHRGESGIIYCFSRKQVDQLTVALKQEDFSVTNYHAGLSDEDRTAHQDDFIRDKKNIIVATVAFGMGINKPDVRFVIHYDMPKSVEQYYQEIGRAGRDGLQATALLLYSASDIFKIKYFFDESSDVENCERLLDAMVKYAESRTCRRKQLLSYFGENYTSPSSGGTDCCCDICSKGADDKTDVTIPAQKLLSCILRTEERYGASYIIDILLGSKNKRISDNGHDSLSTWGIGRDLSKDDWFELSNCLVDDGYLSRSEEYKVLSLTGKGHEALSARKNFLFPIQFAGAKKKSSRSRSKTLQVESPSYEEGMKSYGTYTEGRKHTPQSRAKKAASMYDTSDEEAVRIASQLRKWRVKYADELNVPPYVVFGDKTLADIASKKPQTVSELLDCHGIGEVKAEKFGEAVIRIVKNE